MATPLGPIELDRRLRWLLVGRLGVAVCGMAAILAVHILRGEPRVPPAASPASCAYYTLFAACILNLGYIAARHFLRNAVFLAWVQLLVDVALESFLVYYTGVDGVFAYLYFATVIAAAMILSGRASLLVASTSTVLLSVVFIAHFLEAQSAGPAGGPVPRVLQELNALVVHLAFFALSLHVVALLAGRLAAEVRRVRILNDEILQTMSDGVVTIDRDGRVAFVNRPARHLLGLSGGVRLEGRSFESLGADALERVLRETLQTGEPTQTSVRLARPDGSAIALDLTASILEDAESRVRGVVAILHDATLREAVEEMERRAERFRALAEMSTGMAHEIRNPLASIRGAAQALRDDAARPEDSRLLAVVVRESDRLEAIVDHFLRFARHRPPVLRDVDVHGLLQEVASLLRSRPDTRAIDIAVETDAPLRARCDADQVKQVLLNLGLNAVEALAERAGTGARVLLRARREEADVSARPISSARLLRPGAAPPLPAVEGPRLRIEFIDNGPGIAPAHQARLFEPFFSTKPRGTGMGLAIARRIVEAHGGTIAIDSLPGRGTTFRILLPA
jgi:PAS domain S-box-containing protein